MSERPKISGWLAASIGATTLAVVALLALAGFRAYVRAVVQARLEPEKLDFLLGAVPLRPERINPPRFSEETMAAAARVETEWEKLGGDRLQAPQEMLYSGGAALQIALDERPDSIVAETVRGFVRRADAFTTAVAALVARPDYALPALPPSSREGAASGPNIMLADWGASLLAAQAKLDADAGRWRAALARSIASIRLARAGEDIYVSELHSVSLIVSGSSAAFAVLARRCDDAPALREALASLEELEPRLSPPEASDPYAPHFICGLQRARAAGFEPNLSASPTGREIAAEFLRWQWTLAPDAQSAERAQLRRAVAASMGMKPQSSDWIAALAVDMKLAVPHAADAYMAGMPDAGYLRAQARRSRVSFDLLRLNVAARIFELENARPPKGIEEIVPKLVRAAPTDPETGKPYDWEHSVIGFARKTDPRK